MRMPALFVGHGSPMNAITDTPYSRAWKAFGAALPRPRAILSISAHWYTEGTAVTAMPRPRTIHDFGRFPKALHEMEYPAPGDPALAADVAKLLSPMPVGLDLTWGLDHGTWSVLVHAYPKADIPVVQLSIDADKAPAAHFEIGGKLAPLRESSVLVIGFGNIVHNIERMNPNAAPYDWAVRFDDRIRAALAARDDAALIDYTADPDAKLAAPDADHFYPVLYIAGIRAGDDAVTFPVEGLEAGSISMRSFQVA